MKGVTIERAGRVVARSRNLRGFADYARRVRDASGRASTYGTARHVQVFRLPPATPRARFLDVPRDYAARVRVTFADGATGEACFASYPVALRWAERFATWRGAAFTRDA